MPFRTEPLYFNGSNYVLKAGDTMTGSLLASPTNTIDLGSAALAWRTGYFGTSLVLTTAALSMFTIDTVNAAGIGIGLTTAESIQIGRATKNIEFMSAVARFFGAVEPDTNNAYDVGSNTRGWRTGYFSTSVRTVALVGTSAAATAFDLDTANASDIDIGKTVATGVNLGRAGKNVVLLGDELQPTTNNSRDLGDATKAFRTGFFAASILGNSAFLIDTTDAANAVLIGNTTAGGVTLSRATKKVTVAGDVIIPSANNNRDLGESATAWRTAYLGTSLLFNAAGTIDQTVAAALSIAPTNANALNLGRAAITTKVLGTLRYDNTDVAAGSATGTYLVIDVGGVTHKIALLAAA